MKKKWLLCLMALALLLGGCAEKKEKNAAETPQPILVEAPEIEAEGKLAEAARRRMEIYERQLNKIALQYPANLSYTIPGDLIAKMASDAQEMGVAPENGRYQFTWRQSSRHTYQISGWDVAKEMEESALEMGGGETAQDLPDNQKMGDFSAAGGGEYDRTYAYDVAEDLSQGNMEITDLLNGERTGHELFSFYVQGNIMYFVDAALELTADLDVLLSDGSYLVAIGKLETDRVEIMEYMVSDESEIPSAVSMDWEKLKKSVTPVSHLTAQEDQIQVQ